MLLPCPHCRRQFRLHRERIRSERAGIQCPVCGGVFYIHVAPPPPADKQPSSVEEGQILFDASKAPPVKEPALPDSRLARDDLDRLLADRGKSLPDDDLLSNASPPTQPPPWIHPDAAVHGRARRKPGSLTFWTLVPACFLFVVVTGILLSGPQQKTSVPNDPSVRAGTGSDHSLSSSVSSQPEVPRSGKERGEEAGLEPPNLSSLTEDPVAHAFWASPNSESGNLCEVLLRPPNADPSVKDEDSCQLYPPWITYLVLDTQQTPACELEPAFVRATSAIEQHALCGQGYAFLSAYYLKMNVLDRAQPFLEEALRLDPSNPWVRLVEAIYERARGENQRALDILEELHQEYPAFLVPGYLLAKAHILQEDYRRANEIFQSRKEDVKGQVAFWRIRRALSSLENAPDYSVQKAEALLAMSRAFATLKDYPMAEHLHSWILEEMPGKLPKGERTAAYCELARIYETRGEKSKAYDSYRSAIDIDPDFQDALEGISHLLPSRANQS